MGTHNKSIKSELASRVLYGELKGKKEKETESLLLILERLGLGNYQITRSDESPDFIISFNDGNSKIDVACEMTSLYSDRKPKVGSPERRFFEKWKKIAKDLRHRLDGDGFENVYGVLFFKKPSHASLDSVRPVQLIDELIGICKEYLGNNSEIVFPLQDFPLLSALLTSLRLYQYPETGILWWCAHLQSDSVADPNDALIHSIATKIDKAKSYNWENATEKWLVIVAEAKGLVDLAVLTEDPGISKQFGTVEFTRIILWDRFLDEIIEIFPTFRKLCDSLAQVRHLEYYPESLKPFILGGPKYPTRLKGG